MKPALADRLCRALVACYPRRWKRRYAEELLDVLDQHPAGPRTVLSLAGAALTTHLDPGYRTEIRLMPRLSKNAKLAVVMSVAVPAVLVAPVAVPIIAQNISESRWHLSNSGAVGPVAFSGDRRMLASAADGPPWSGTSILWDVTNQALPRRLAEFEGGDPTTISPDGRTVATIAFGGQPILWNVTRPARATRIATLPGRPGDYFTALAFSPQANLLPGVTFHGNVLVFRLGGPGHPVRVTTLPLLASARFPGGAGGPVDPCNPGCATAAYAIGFTPDGHALTVVIDRTEAFPNTTDRDTVYTWQVASSGALSDLTTIYRNVSDSQPTLAPGDRIVADGSELGGKVHLWTLP
jgi:WD40 repeat protein